MLANLELALEAGLTQFGEDVTYTPASGGPAFEVAGVWGAPHAELEIAGAESTISTTAPKLGVDLPDFLARKLAAGHPETGPAAGDSFVRQAVTWRVIDVKPDSLSRGLTLVLHRG